MARVYAITFAAQTISAAQDIFEIVAPAAGIVRIAELIFSQSSDQGDAQAEALGIQFIRGFTTSGTGGTAATPAPTNSSFSAASSVCEVNNTTVATGGTTVTLLADVMNEQAGYQKTWTPETMLVLRNSERGVVRITAPGDAITAYGTLYFIEE